MELSKSKRWDSVDRANPACPPPPPALSVPDPTYFFPHTLQIRGTGPGGQLQDLDCSSSDDEGATQNSTKPR